VGAAGEIVRANTQLRSVALVPEIRLYQASEPIGVWQRTEQAAGRAGLDPPFWAFAWAGGQALARYVLDHPETVRDRQVIDIASGSGLVAIAAARAGAAAVTGYDIDPLAIAAITLNAAANAATVLAVQADILDTGILDTGILDTGGPGPDVILVADAFYERELARRVTRFAEQGQACGADVLIGDLGRAYLPRDRLAPLAAYDVPGLSPLEDRDVKRTTVWALLAAGGPGPGPREAARVDAAVPFRINDRDVGESLKGVAEHESCGGHRSDRAHRQLPGAAAGARWA
jgi:predicted nicotinamide N-methyase